MTRLINQTLDYSSFTDSEPRDGAQNRAESRLTRTLPVFLIACATADDNVPPAIQTGFTVDVSCYGISLLLPETMNLDQVVVLIGDPKHRKVMRGTCRNRTPLGLGTCRYGIRLDEVLKDSDYAPLLHYAEALELKSQQAIDRESNSAATSVRATG
ncbi:PilZ domain-containing protein [Rosistilla carotiformis]|nr:PilZ domain-containing protein [Rosistilla carotiformis]